MKKIAQAAILLLALVQFSIAQDEGKHLFICSGQSNMAGLDLELSFIPTLESEFGKENIIVVKDAHGGQPIRRWYKAWVDSDGNKPDSTGDLYERLMTKVKKEISGKELKTISFFWMQGERDAREQHGAVYKKSLAGLIDQIREDLEVEDIFVVIGRLSDFDLDNRRYKHWTQVREAQVELAEDHDNFAWIDTDDLNDGENKQGKTITNDLHMSVEGYKTMGKRFADAGIELIKGVPENNRQSQLKILNWNVLYGFNHHKSVEAGCQWIQEQTPDVVALQELNGWTKKSFDELAKSSGGWGHEHTALLKEKGFPVGLTSNQPIEIIKRQVDGFHHGYLHCRTHDIHFFIVHFWPKKDHEGAQVASEIAALLETGEEVILLGDFNTNSSRDSNYLSERTKVTPQYNVVEMFEKTGMVDLVATHSPDAKYTCPSPITIPKWSKDREELLLKRQRIDFIFASQGLAKRSKEGFVITDKAVESVSDHYPVVATIAHEE